MPSLFLVNIRTDYATSVKASTGLLGSSHSLSDTCSRFLWHLQLGDILVTSEPVRSEYLWYVSSVLGVSLEPKQVIVSDQLNDDSLTEPDLLRVLRTRMHGTGGWRIEPFLWTAGVLRLADQVGIRNLPNRGFVESGGVAHINLKSAFRDLAEGLGLGVPKGSVETSAAGVAQAIQRLKAEADALIVKHERGGGGRGNTGLVRVGNPALKGTFFTRDINADLEDLASSLWGQLSEGAGSSVIVEVYMPSDKPFYAEWHIDDSVADLVGVGDIRYERADRDPLATPAWEGLTLPASLEDHLLDRVIADTKQIVRSLQSSGFRGFVNVDGLVTANGDLVYHEINARWGGGLVASTIADSLLGRDWQESAVVATVLNIRRAELGDILRMLQESHLAYDPSRREGALLLSVDSDLGSGSEYMLLATSAGHLAHLHGRLLSETAKLAT